MRSIHLPTIAKVRLLVGALGERLEWWRTQFTHETSQRSLEIIFPQTALRAALESVTEAARRVHDEPLDPRSFHLFRLPSALEDRLADWLAAAPEKTIAWPPAQRDDIVAQLQRLAGKSALSVAEGPQSLGDSARLNDKRTFEDLASAYVIAARSGFRPIPYFQSEE
jgi:hypothetical protein